MELSNSHELLEQTRQHAARVIQQLSADKADLEANKALDPLVKAEGLERIQAALAAARKLLEDTERALAGANRP